MPPTCAPLVPPTCLCPQLVPRLVSMWCVGAESGPPDFKDSTQVTLCSLLGVTLLRWDLFCSVNSFRFLGVLVLFVEGPGKAHGYPRRTFQGSPEAPGPGLQNLNTHTFHRALLSG